MCSTPIFSFGLPPPEAGLQALTIEYLEHMRCFCRQNGYEIQKLFEQFDPMGTGDVPDYTFFHIIHSKFWNQIGFSIEQVRVIADLFRNPLGEVSYKRLHEWMKSDDNIVDQMIQLHCTCASLFQALVSSLISTVYSSCLISPDPPHSTTATYATTTCLGSMFPLSLPSTPLPPSLTHHCGFGQGGELVNPVLFTLGRTDKQHVRKPRSHRDHTSVVRSPSSAYSFRPFSPLNISFTGETSPSPSIISSICGITESGGGEPVSQPSSVTITPAESFDTPSETSWVSGGDRGHLAPQNPKYLSYTF